MRYLGVLLVALVTMGACDETEGKGSFIDSGFVFSGRVQVDTVGEDENVVVEEEVQKVFDTETETDKIDPNEPPCEIDFAELAMGCDETIVALEAELDERDAIILEQAELIAELDEALDDRESMLMVVRECVVEHCPQ